MYRSRVMKEIAEAKKMKESNIVLALEGDDLFKWKAFIFGPEGSPFEDGIFELKITLNSQYPVNAPKCVFKTRVFHPNIHWESGEICLDILKDQWTPAWTLESTCVAIIDLLGHPNADSPLNCDAGNMIRAGDLDAYKQMAKLYTLDYAIPKREFEKELKAVLSNLETLYKTKND